MAIIKWNKGDENDQPLWETFYKGAFKNIVLNIKNINTAINNAARSIGLRCRRDYNLSDIYSASEGRRNLELILDCSDSNRLGSTTHHHDSIYYRKPQVYTKSEVDDFINAIWGSDGKIDSHNITEIWKRINSIKECECEHTTDPGSGSDPGSDPGSGSNPQGYRLLDTINITEPMYGSGSPYDRTETRTYDADFLKFIFDGTVKGVGKVAVQVFQTTKFKDYSVGNTETQVHAELGPFTANNGETTIFTLRASPNGGWFYILSGTFQVWGYNL